MLEVFFPPVNGKLQDKLPLKLQLHKPFNVNYTLQRNLPFFREEGHFQFWRLKWNRYCEDKLYRTSNASTNCMHT